MAFCTSYFFSFVPVEIQMNKFFSVFDFSTVEQWKRTWMENHSIVFSTSVFHDDCCEYIIGLRMWNQWIKDLYRHTTPSSFRFILVFLLEPVSSPTKHSNTSETEAIMFEIKNWKIKMTSWGGWVNRQIRQTSWKLLCVETEHPKIRYAISHLICDWMKENNKLRSADVLWVRNGNWSKSATCVTWISVPQHFKGADERNLYPLPNYFAKNATQYFLTHCALRSLRR